MTSERRVGWPGRHVGPAGALVALLAAGPAWAEGGRQTAGPTPSQPAPTAMPAPDVAPPGAGNTPAAGVPTSINRAPAGPVPSASPAALPSAAAQSPPAPKPKTPAPLRLATISSDPRPTLTPDTFIATTRAAEAYLRIAENGGWPGLPAGPAPKLGDRGAAVAALRKRLAATGDLGPDDRGGDLFDPSLAASVRRFQGRHGLPETGLVGPRTVAALNVPAAERYRQLAGSAQRLLGSAFAFGERYVVVNIPSATVEAVEGGRVVRRYVAVAGKKDRASPRVETRITNVNFNPTWTVPTSLIRKDIIPHMRKDPAYLVKHRIRILDGQGREVDPAAIDWSTERAVNFTLRQDPHDGNSLGQVRIDMPNRHAVYMHDTPTKRLFALDARFHSSGCVRVADVRALVEWLLQGNAPPAPPVAAAQPVPAPAGAAGGTGGAQAGSAGGAPTPLPGSASVGGAGWTGRDIESAIASGRRLDVRLAKPVPVAWVYLTGYATADGTVHFRDDVYDLDAGIGPPPALEADDVQTASIPRRTP